MTALSYKMTLYNATDEPWHFAVYQRFPESPGLSSVAWQVRLIPKQTGTSPSSAEINWKMDYGLCIADFGLNEKKFTGSQYVKAVLGKIYQVFTEVGIPTISPAPIGKTATDQMVLKNNTNSPVVPVTMGFTLDNNMVAAEEGIGGQEYTTFRVHPSFYVAAYRDVVLGQLVDEDIAIGPVKVEYTPGVVNQAVSAYKDASGNYYMKVGMPSEC